MCGIVCAIANRDIKAVLLDGLARLEYRGYDAAGLALLNGGPIEPVRAVGPVAELEKAAANAAPVGSVGIAHTRWATHGRPCEKNAHPQVSGGRVAVVHNGIIENYRVLRSELESAGYAFGSDTDTEVIAHLLDHHLTGATDKSEAFRVALERLEGAYAVGVIHRECPAMLFCARMGSPLVIGVGAGEAYVASDPLALLAATDRFIYLGDGEYGCVTTNVVDVWDAQGATVEPVVERYAYADYTVSRDGHRHFMHKEIHEQPRAIANTLAGKISQRGVLPGALGLDAESLLPKVRALHIVACGTSYHAALVARYWIEAVAGLPCQVEIASEYRYRRVLVPPDTLFIAISQSGETADTLAALRHARCAGYLTTLAICNVPGSSAVRESGLQLMTDAGPEIGVASTKAFTTQLTALYWLALVLGRYNDLDSDTEGEHVAALRDLPQQVEKVLAVEDAVTKLAPVFAGKAHTLFLGRGVHFPVALEGALKLKEISYIHAEAYPAGELKHGPLALVDADMPVVSVAPNDELAPKLRSNLEEVRARGGHLVTFADHQLAADMMTEREVVALPEVRADVTPITYTVPLQLLAYHVALLKGTDVDKPRNLAKSVTVE